MTFRFEGFEIWHLAIGYAGKLYNIAECFPKSELFGLKSQLCRAGVSVSSNIAEGSAADSDKDFRHYLDIGIKSLYETVSILFFAKHRGYVSDALHKKLYEESEHLARKIRAFRNAL